MNLQDRGVVGEERGTIHGPGAGQVGTGRTQFRAGGGDIFTPRGTDTVPAMLTPGEFVVRKAAVDSVGVGYLNALNKTGKKAGKYAKGGEVQYFQDGSPGGVSSGQPLKMNVSKFQRAVNDFSRTVGDFTTAFEGGFSFKHTGTINVVVTLNDTASIFSAAQGSFEGIAAAKVAEGINNMLKENFPDLPRAGAELFGGGEGGTAD